MFFTAMSCPSFGRLWSGSWVQRCRDGSRYVLAPTFVRQREAAERLDLQFKKVDGRGVHDRARARSLAHHRALAMKLRKEMVDEARHVLFRWRQDRRIDPRYADRWESLLDCRSPNSGEPSWANARTATT